MNGVDHNAEVVKSHASDHDMITISVPLRRARKRPRTILTRSIRTVNWDHLCLDLIRSDWSATARGNNKTVDQMYADFLNIWNAAIERHCPLKLIKLRHPDRPWLTMNEELQELQLRRDQARRQRDELSTLENQRIYESLKREFKQELEKARADFFSKPPSAKDMWRDIRQHALGPSQHFKPDDIPDEDTANRFNNFFANVGSNIADELAERGDAQPPPARPPTVCSSTFVVRPATLPELSHALWRMSSSKAAGSDGVQLQMIKRCFAVIEPHILNIINHSIVRGEVPAVWKHATVVPIWKSGDRTQPSNFRPVSVLNAISKLAEKVVGAQLSNYLREHSILSPTQHAYRKGHSTESALLDLTSVIGRNREAGLVTCVTSCDLSKAFDSIDRSKLLSKLKWYGISPHWFQDYFTDRTQSVRSSGVLNIDHGVIQGSNLGPVMYTLFTNDLPCHLSPHASIVSYADDTQIIHSAPPTSAGLGELRSKVEGDLKSLARWFTANGLKVNPSKTELVLFGTPAALKKIPTDFALSFGDAQVKPVPDMKVLGVQLDGALNMQKQTDKVVQRCYGTLISISKISSMLPKKTLIRLIESLVFSQIAYCLPAWVPPTQKQRDRIQKVINFAVRIVFRKKKWDHISESRKKLGWMDFETLVKYRDSMCIHHLMHDPDAPNGPKQQIQLRSDVSSRCTRATSHGRLQTARCRLSATKAMFSARATGTWEALPASVKRCRTKVLFKKQVRSVFR